MCKRSRYEETHYIYERNSYSNFFVGITWQRFLYSMIIDINFFVISNDLAANLLNTRYVNGFIKSWVSKGVLALFKMATIL